MVPSCGAGHKLEHHLPEIAIELIVTGEIFYRARLMHQREWLIERKTDLGREERERLAEEARLAEETRKKKEQDRIDHLLSQAHAQADRIDPVKSGAYKIFF